VLPPPSFTRIRHQIHLSCLQFLPLNYHHSHFFWFLHIFFTLAIWGCTSLQLGCFCIGITSFCNCIFIIHLWPALVLSFLLVCFFFYYRSDAENCNYFGIDNTILVHVINYIIAFPYILHTLCLHSLQVNSLLHDLWCSESLDNSCWT